MKTKRSEFRAHLKSEAAPFEAAITKVNSYDVLVARQAASERTARRWVIGIVAILAIALICSL